MISLHGAYENENFGDELLIAIQAGWIQEMSKEVGLPFASKVYHEQINSSDKRGEECLNLSEKLIYTGGGYFGEPNHKRIKWGLDFFRKKHHIPAKLFRKNNKKYLIAGVGAGPISNLLTRKKIVKMCNSAEKVIIRDESSYYHLLNYGVYKKKLIVAADVVLSLSPKDIPISAKESVSNNINKKNNDFYLGIHIGVSPDDEHYKENIKNVMESIAKVVNENKLKPVLIADKRKASSTQEKAIKLMMNLLKMEPIVYRHENIWETCALLGNLDGVITTKLHVGITAYSLGTKAFGIAAHQKTKRFYEQINKPHYFYELKDINNNISDRINSFINDNYWDDKTIKVRKKLKNDALVCKDEIHNFLK